MNDKQIIEQLQKELDEEKQHQAEKDAMNAKQINAPLGWTCPACGGGNSPYSTRCPCVILPPPKLTCSGSTK